MLKETEQCDNERKTVEKSNWWEFEAWFGQWMIFIESNDFCAGCGAYNHVGIDADWAWTECCAFLWLSWRRDGKTSAKPQSGAYTLYSFSPFKYVRAIVEVYCFIAGPSWWQHRYSQETS